MRAAFTLVEMIVVVAIIATLIALLLPALKSAREQGRRAVCLSNQRQVTMVQLTYATDYSDFFPVSSYASANTVETPIPPDVQGDAYDDYGVWIPRYFRDPRMRFCPSGDPTIPIHNPTGLPAGDLAPAYYRDWDNKAGAFGYRFMVGCGSYKSLTNPDADWYGWYFPTVTVYDPTIDQAPCPRLRMAGTTIASGPQNKPVTLPAPARIASVLDLFNPSERMEYLYIYGSYYTYQYPPGGLYYLKTINHPGQGGENVTFLDGHGGWRNAGDVKPRLKRWVPPSGSDYEIYW